MSSTCLGLWMKRERRWPGTGLLFLCRPAFPASTGPNAVVFSDFQLRESFRLLPHGAGWRIVQDAVPCGAAIFSLCVSNAHGRQELCARKNQGACKRFRFAVTTRVKL